MILQYVYVCLCIRCCNKYQFCGISFTVKIQEAKEEKETQEAISKSMKYPLCCYMDI